MYRIVAAEPDEPPPFAELYCRSNFTFLTGAAQPEDLVQRAAAKMYSALAPTVECTVSGVVRGHLAAKENGLHFIVGSEILLTTAGGTAATGRRFTRPRTPYQVVLSTLRLEGGTRRGPHDLKHKRAVGSWSYAVESSVLSARRRRETSRTELSKDVRRSQAARRARHVDRRRGMAGVYASTGLTLRRQPLARRGRTCPGCASAPPRNCA